MPSEIPLNPAGRSRALIRGFLFWLLALCLGAAQLAVHAADDPDSTLAADRQIVERVDKALEAERVEAEDLAGMRERLLGVEQRASAIAEEQAPLLKSAEARLQQLGAAPAAGDAPDLAEQRQALQKEISQLDARLKLARLLVLTSDQLADKAAQRARERFAADLLRPTEPLLGARFRASLSASQSLDGRRLERATRGIRSAVEAQTPDARMAAVAAIGLAVVLRLGASRLLESFVMNRAPATRLRRSLLVLTSSLLAMLVPGVTAAALAVTLAEDSGAAGSLLTSSVGMACFCGFVGGLGRALLSVAHPSWRLPPIPDAAARRLRHIPSVLAATLFIGWFLQGLTELAQLSLPTLVMMRAVVALVLALVLARLLARWSDRGPASVAAARPLGLVLILVPGLARALLVLAALAIFAGYVALGSFLVGQMAWTLILVCGGYTAWIVIGDVAEAWAAGASTQAPEPGMPPRLELRRQQAAVLLSGALRILLLLLLVVLLLAPFGEGPGELLGRGQWLSEGVAVGQLQLRPAAIAQAVAVAIGVFVAARAFQRWTADRLLPTTALDEGMRSSIIALVGFLGGVLAVALGLSAMGLALTQVAWIASALTVGIGFGMQSIVSNFVSGLILLAERPVKVGDWVALSGLEGDIRRMNVRTTEIQMADRSTVIVPNSEFITKVVRNVTHDTQAQGLVQIRLPMPLDTDTERVRAILLQAFREHEEILSDPAASVLLDGIEGDKLIFSATGFVASPRRVAAARSELLFRIMPALRTGDAPPP